MSLATVLANPSAAQTPTNFSEYRRSLQQLGLTPLIPASTLPAPGYIYHLQKNTSGNRFQKTVCRQAFTAPAVTSTLSFPDAAVARERGFDLSLKFLPPLLADKIHAAFNVSGNQQSNVAISIPSATSFEIAQRVALDPKTGELVRRTLAPDCAEILLSLPRNAEGGFRIPLYMVISAISPEKMKFTLDRTQGGKLAVDAKATGQIAAGTGMKLESTTNQSFVLARASGAPRQFIAANIVRLETADPNTEVSAVPTHSLRWTALPPDAPAFATETPQ